MKNILLVSHILQLILQGFRVNNRVDWKFPGYLGEGLEKIQKLTSVGRFFGTQEYCAITSFLFVCKYMQGM